MNVLLIPAACLGVLGLAFVALFFRLTSRRRINRYAGLRCDEIQARTARGGHVVRHNNANKVLKRVPALARRLEVEGARVRYDITNAGRAYLRYLDRHIREHGQEHQPPQGVQAPVAER